MSDKISQIENYFYNNEKNLIHKWDHYFEIYDRHFKKYKDKDIVLLEVGVFVGNRKWKAIYKPLESIFPEYLCSLFYEYPNLIKTA